MESSEGGPYAFLPPVRGGKEVPEEIVLIVQSLSCDVLDPDADRKSLILGTDFGSKPTSGIWELV